MPDASAPIFDLDEMLAWIQRQAGFGARRAGSAAGLANEQFLAGELRAFGLESVRAEPIPVTVWEPERVSLATPNADIEAFPIPYCAFTPSSQGVEAPLVLASRSAIRPRPEWRGKIVVATINFPMLRAEQLVRLSLAHHDPDGSLQGLSHPATWIRLGWHLYKLAAQSGAVGFVGILADQPGGSCRMYAPYGFRERDILDKPLPGVWVGRGAADALTAAAVAGKSARLVLTGRSKQGLTHNIVGEIPGAAPDAEAVVLSCHHDSPFASPVEDASGIAVVLALAKHFATARDLKRRIVVLLSAGHFYGSIGTRTFIAQNAGFVRKELALEISLEHIAREAIENHRGELVATGRAEPSAAFVSFNSRIVEALMAAVSAHGVDRVLALPAAGPLGDYPPTDGGDWYAAGVPVVNFIANPVYLLTDGDALAWVDQGRLVRVAGAFASFLRATDGMSRAALRVEDKQAAKALNRLLGLWTSARGSFFGLKPLH